MSTSDFDNASGLRDSSVLFRHQNLVEIGKDQHGNIVLRERCWPDDDQNIAIAPENLLRLVVALLDASGADDIALIRDHGGSCSDLVPALWRRESDRIELPADHPGLDLKAAYDDFRSLERRGAFDEDDKKSKAAERARRYRANKQKRDASRDDGVTQRDEGVTRDVTQPTPWFIAEERKVASAR